MVAGDRNCHTGSMRDGFVNVINGMLQFWSEKPRREKAAGTGSKAQSQCYKLILLKEAETSLHIQE